jgi:TIR domain
MNKIDVFLSYAREDSVEADRLYHALLKAGLSVWFDKESLRPGERWQIAVEGAIRNARYFIALMSSRSATKRGFVQKEIRRALEILDEFPDDETYLIPVRVNDCSPAHARLADLHWTDLFPEWEPGVEKLLRFFGVAEHAPTIAPTVRLDGLYQSRRLSHQGADYTRYLRFYADGFVIAVSSTGSAAEVAPWFTREKSDSGGWYTLRGSALSFADTSPEGTVDYEGEIVEGMLAMRTHSHINGHRDVHEFSYTPFESRRS